MKLDEKVTLSVSDPEFKMVIGTLHIDGPDPSAIQNIEPLLCDKTINVFALIVDIYTKNH